MINGLPLMTFDALSGLWGIPDPDLYYKNCVFGGPGSFLIPVLDWGRFPSGVRRKLVLEIANLPTPPRIPTPAQARIIKAQATPAYDCLIGEKMWEQNRSFLDIP